MPFKDGVKRDQYLYAAAAGDGVLKIGISTNPDRRIKDIGIMWGRRAMIVWQSDQPVASAREIETRIKHRLRFRRVRGEWFVCTMERMTRTIGWAIDQTSPAWLPQWARYIRQMRRLKDRHDRQRATAAAVAAGIAAHRAWRRRPTSTTC
jgi:hypothetical protein